MGKWVLIEFDNDESADALCAQINTATAKGKAYRIIGLFAKPPKKRCECQHGVERRVRPVKRHRMTGFWYCTKCKRVMKGPQSPRNQLDDPALAPNWFAKGEPKEATMVLDVKGEAPIKNYPITERMG